MNIGHAVFILQIAYPNGDVVQLPAGGKLERDLIATCTESILQQPMGWWRTDAKIRTAVSAGIQAALMELKRESVHAVQSASQ